IKIDHTERETTGVVGKAERLTWHKAWTMVSTGFSISYTSSGNENDLNMPSGTIEIFVRCHVEVERIMSAMDRTT
ncbi:hypothetical protein, partial [Escherichia coli]|uniref:hypothetical protein n=1 Tax=Escherichia coli TaxID=562 RepID=UPI000BB8083A